MTWGRSFSSKFSEMVNAMRNPRTRERMRESVMESGEPECGCDGRGILPQPPPNTCVCHGFVREPPLTAETFTALTAQASLWYDLKPFLTLRCNHVFRFDVPGSDYKYCQIMGGGGQTTVNLLCHKTWAGVQHEQSTPATISEPYLNIDFDGRLQLHAFTDMCTLVCAGSCIIPGSHGREVAPAEFLRSPLLPCFHVVKTNGKRPGAGMKVTYRQFDVGEARFAYFLLLAFKRILQVPSYTTRHLYFVYHASCMPLVAVYCVTNSLPGVLH
jgi:hypothetical protein